MLREDNLLLLDEPTNHLDMDSREVLESALADFPGTILTVSHDRYFINRIADRVVEMQPDGVAEYLGNYDDYVEKKNRPLAPVEAGGGKTRTELDKEKKRDRQSKLLLKQLRQRAQEAEAAIARQEAEIAALEEKMSDPALYADPDRAAETTRAYQQAQQALPGLYDAWEEAEQAVNEAE